MKIVPTQYPRGRREPDNERVKDLFRVLLAEHGAQERLVAKQRILVIETARAAGVSWEKIGEALDMNPVTVRTRYGREVAGQ